MKKTTKKWYRKWLIALAIWLYLIFLQLLGFYLGRLDKIIETGRDKTSFYTDWLWWAISAVFLIALLLPVFFIILHIHKHKKSR